MTTFTVTGHQGENVVELTWTDGELSGDERTVEFLRAKAEAFDGEAIVPAPARGTTHNHLQDAWSAYFLMHFVFSDAPRITAGDLPMIEMPPDGAVI